MKSKKFLLKKGKVNYSTIIGMSVGTGILNRYTVSGMSNLIYFPHKHFSYFIIISFLTLLSLSSRTASFTNTKANRMGRYLRTFFALMLLWFNEKLPKHGLKQIIFCSHLSSKTTTTTIKFHEKDVLVYNHHNIFFLETKENNNARMFHIPSFIFFLPFIA